VTYEAGPTGFGLYRTLTAAGVRCVVAAPSKLHRRSGDRVKTDAKDALHLARLLRLGEITPVAVPSLEQEAARDLVRAREDCRGVLMRARHRLSKLLLRQGIVYSGGQAWPGAHELWLRRQRFDTAATTMVAYPDYGPDAVAAQGALNRPAFVNDLVHTWLPQIPVVQARLADTNRPARVADIGCGLGWAALELAKAFPHVASPARQAGPASRCYRSSTRSGASTACLADAPTGPATTHHRPEQIRNRFNRRPGRSARPGGGCGARPGRTSRRRARAGRRPG
jgi:hypothetical protein